MTPAPSHYLCLNRGKANTGQEKRRPAAHRSWVPRVQWSTVLVGAAWSQGQVSLSKKEALAKLCCATLEQQPACCSERWGHGELGRMATGGWHTVQCCWDCSCAGRCTQEAGSLWNKELFAELLCTCSVPDPDFLLFFTAERSICKRLFLDMKNLLFNGPNCCTL